MVQGRVLVVAGSDPSGGAGLEADQKVLAAHHCYAMTATTALTVQNTRGVTEVQAVAADFVGRQMDAVASDVGVDVVKTGMLGSAATVDVVCDMIEKHGVRTVVVDPVMVATSGARLLEREAVGRLCARLVGRHATIVTPNVHEARMLLEGDEGSGGGEAGVARREVRTVQDLERLGREIRRLGPEWVLVKGGHCPVRVRDDGTVVDGDGDGGGDGDGDGEERTRMMVVDVLVGPGDDIFKVQSPFQTSRNTHGTGCSLASAIAANLAQGKDMPAAVRLACRYVAAAIESAPGLGGGYGPLNHFHSSYSLPFSSGYFIEYLLERDDVKPVWNEFVHHKFVMGLGNGKLPLESFKGYIIQDYLYLVQFARANALAAYKANNIHEIERSSEIVRHIIMEVNLHIGYCKQFGISESELRATPEHQACTAYTRYVLDIGQSEDWLALQFALAPCLLGYNAVAEMLVAHPNTIREPSDNVYWRWIENYCAADYVGAVRLGSALPLLLVVGINENLKDLIERYIRSCSPSKVEDLVKIFIHATKMEIGFWEMFPAE